MLKPTYTSGLIHLHMRFMRRSHKIIFIGVILALSVLPFLLTLAATAIGPHGDAVKRWYARRIEPVQELRPLAAFPVTWEGRWFNVDKNYMRFEKWFSDHLGLRDMMIRSKNELDYRLFRSSSRVYFGKDEEIYGRMLVDRELPATESFLDHPGKIEDTYRGVARYAEKLKAQGITPVFIMPMQKQYFWRGRLPFFAPHLPESTNFMALYRRIQSDRTLHVVDVYGIIKSLQGRFPIYYRQDFHWTNMTALTVAKEATHLIAGLEKSDIRWRYPIKMAYQPFVGSDARFAARLNVYDTVLEPKLIKTWKDTQTIRPLDAKQTGLEFETDEIDDPQLLPPTCLYGNSFSDGMIESGLVDYFQKFTKVDRARSLPEVPDLIKGRCKYLIVQVLDIQTGHWMSFSNQ